MLNLGVFLNPSNWIVDISTVMWCLLLEVRVITLLFMCFYSAGLVLACLIMMDSSCLVCFGYGRFVLYGLHSICIKQHVGYTLCHGGTMMMLGSSTITKKTQVFT